jgi:hypothetical protein
LQVFVDAGGGTRTPDTRIMIPANFGLATGISGPVGHAVGHIRAVVLRTAATSRYSLSSLLPTTRPFSEEQLDLLQHERVALDRGRVMRLLEPDPTPDVLRLERRPNVPNTL